MNSANDRRRRPREMRYVLPSSLFSPQQSCTECVGDRRRSASSLRCEPGRLVFNRPAARSAELSCRYAVSRCATSATRSSGAPANPPLTGSAGRSVAFMNRSLCSLESHTTEIRYPPSVGPATCAVCPSGSPPGGCTALSIDRYCSSVPPFQKCVCKYAMASIPSVSFRLTVTGSGPLDPEPGYYVRAGCLAGSADLLQQARQVEVVMRLPDALPLNLEHLRGFEADPATGRGDVAGGHVERSGLGALPCQFQRDGAVVSHCPLDPPLGIGECF